MKKFIKLLSALIACVIMLTTFCSCSAQQTNRVWQPVSASPDVVHYAERAIEIIDSYLHFKINAQEAEDAFEELYDRIDQLDISYSNEKYNLADQAINSAISHIHPFSADEFNDTALYMYRDVFAYQIGEDVSSRVYPPEKRSYIADGAEELVESLDHLDIPFSYILSHASADYASLSIEFDKMNGITAEDMESLVRNIYGAITREDSVIHSILITYSVYQQEAFVIYLYPSAPYYSFSKSATEDLETITSSDDVFLVIDSMKRTLLSIE